MLTSLSDLQDYIETRLAAGCDVQYLRQLFEFMVYVISKLEAPARRPQTQQVPVTIPHAVSLVSVYVSLGCGRGGPSREELISRQHAWL